MKIMKKIILFLLICLSVSVTKAGNRNLACLNIMATKTIVDTKSKPNKLVCWVAEIVYLSNGDVRVTYRCKEICESCGYAYGNKKLHFNTKI
jgi:hypothetical protein